MAIIRKSGAMSDTSRRQSKFLSSIKHIVPLLTAILSLSAQAENLFGEDEPEMIYVPQWKELKPLNKPIPANPNNRESGGYGGHRPIKAPNSDLLVTPPSNYWVLYAQASGGRWSDPCAILYTVAPITNQQYHRQSDFTKNIRPTYRAIHVAENREYLIKLKRKFSSHYDDNPDGVIKLRRCKYGKMAPNRIFEGDIRPESRTSTRNYRVRCIMIDPPRTSSDFLIQSTSEREAVMYAEDKFGGAAECVAIE